MIKLLYKPAGMLVSVRRAGQSGGGYATGSSKATPLLT